MKYKPKHQKAKIETKKIPELYYWECAYADAIVTPYILYSYIWNELCGYHMIVGNKKYYKTEKDAIEALKRTIRLLKNGLSHYENL